MTQTDPAIVLSIPVTVQQSSPSQPPYSSSVRPSHRTAVQSVPATVLQLSPSQPPYNSLVRPSRRTAVQSIPVIATAVQSAPVIATAVQSVPVIAQPCSSHPLPNQSGPRTSSPMSALSAPAPQLSLSIPSRSGSQRSGISCGPLAGGVDIRR